MANRIDPASLADANSRLQTSSEATLCIPILASIEKQFLLDSNPRVERDCQLALVQCWERTADEPTRPALVASRE